MWNQFWSKIMLKTVIFDSIEYLKFELPRWIWAIHQCKIFLNRDNTISSFQTPAWVPLICALGLFIYQTLDAIDGKQARRTGSSNALGELFDHGCDSLSTVFVTLAGACAMGMGHLPYWMMYQCLMATFLFYIAHWQTYVTGIACAVAHSVKKW